MSEVFDVVIIGAGPGGYVGAVRAAQLGLKTAVVEKDSTLGGTCLNVGCIPSKALLDSSEHFAQVQHEFADHGIEVSGVKLNLPAMMKRKEKVVADLTGGIKYLFEKNKITSFNGIGKILAPGQVEVQGKDTQVIEAKNIIIGTGSVPVELPFIPFDGKNIVSSTEALCFDKVPTHLIVVGGGAIGLEMGSVWMRLGAKVTVIEFADKICGPMDSQISKDLLRILKKQGMEFMLSTKVTGGSAKGGKVTIDFESVKDGKPGSIEGDKVLIAVGRKPFTQGLGLENVGVKTDERGFVLIDDHFQTSVPGIYAMGDVVGGAMLAHKAEEEGVAIAEILAGHSGHVNYNTVPSVIYTWPEVAGVGQTEDELKAQNIPYNVGSFPFTANGRAKAMNCTDGKVKVLADKNTDQVLGVHIVGPRASDMIAEAVVAMEFYASSEDIARSFHAHPTLAEVMREAALAVDKRARQM
ncbi:MAG: dihydrolipoyl dehydrogenase [Bdellovibrionales bacterium]|nr:dihydrolipoyl dehydrogenase [Bdellovibrionales bacterium]